MSVFSCEDSSSRQRGLTAAAEKLRGGELVVIPTDTVYGIAADAFSPQAVARLLEAKQRGPDMPVPVLVSSADAVTALADTVPDLASTLMSAFWPGGLSLVLPQRPHLSWDLGNTHHTVLVRMPQYDTAVELLAATGPLAVSSANISGYPPATTVAEAQQQLGEKVSVYLDGGQSVIGVPSTIVDLVCSPPRILREGAISAEDISAVTGVECSVLLRKEEQ